MLTELLSFTIGYWFYRILRKKSEDKISDTNRLLIIAGAAAGALIGSRFLSVFEEPQKFFDAQNKLIFVFANKTIIGGLLGGLIGVEFTKKLIGVKSSSGDLMTYPIILALIIGRFGCFAEGLLENTYGKSTTFFAGIDFGDGLKRHPLQLYEICVLVILRFFLWRLENKIVLSDGSRFKIFMAVYLLQRFTFEFLKPNSFLLLGLSSIQYVTLFGIAYYWKVFLKPRTLIQTSSISTNPTKSFL